MLLLKLFKESLRSYISFTLWINIDINGNTKYTIPLEVTRDRHAIGMEHWHAPKMVTLHDYLFANLALQHLARAK